MPMGSQDRHHVLYSLSAPNCNLVPASENRDEFKGGHKTEPWNTVVSKPGKNKCKYYDSTVNISSLLLSFYRRRIRRWWLRLATRQRAYVWQVEYILLTLAALLCNWGRRSLESPYSQWVHETTKSHSIENLRGISSGFRFSSIGNNPRPM
jgi:hypothetical protein